jgi:hypothetical protein
MTEDDAVKAAWALVNSSSLSVVSIDSAQHISAALLPPSKENRGDIWVVRFRMPSAADVVESPCLLLVNVDDTSGRATFFRSL